MTLGIDIETYSSVNLKTHGLYNYIQSPDFAILMLSYSLDNGPVHTYDLTADKLPKAFIALLLDSSILKTAHNVPFEFNCLEKYLNIQLDLAQWECTMVLCAQMGLPMSLDKAAKALKLPVEKDMEGKALIRYFSTPCKPTKANGLRTRNLPEHAPDKWARYINYNKKDVKVEQAIKQKLSWFKVPPIEKEYWILDQIINRRGILVDRRLVRHAIAFDEREKEILLNEAIQLTGITNPKSMPQLKKWLLKETGEEIKSLAKNKIPDLLKHAPNDKVKRMLEIKNLISKTSVRKYHAILNNVCSDGRIYYMLQFCGAGKTWRWAGRGVQPHNLPKSKLPIADLELARNLVLSGNFDTFKMLYGAVADTLSQLIRTAFIASPGKKFIVSDFSSIEARLAATYPNEEWRLEVFRTHGKIYEASASTMFKIPIEWVTKESDWRQKGKISELALGFGGGWQALVTMGAYEGKNPISSEADEYFEVVTKRVRQEDGSYTTVEQQGAKCNDVLQNIVDAWRAASPKVQKMWWDVNSAAINCVETKEDQHTNGLTFRMKHNVLFIILPSGRALAYVRPYIITGTHPRTGRITKSLVHEGLTDMKIWGKIRTYGGKIFENIIQGSARDVTATKLYALHKAGYYVVLHVHDEFVIEADETQHLEDVNQIMSEPVPWMPQLPLGAEGFESLFYKKDS